MRIGCHFRSHCKRAELTYRCVQVEPDCQLGTRPAPNNWRDISTNSCMQLNDVSSEQFQCEMCVEVSQSLPLCMFGNELDRWEANWRENMLSYNIASFIGDSSNDCPRNAGTFSDSHGFASISIYANMLFCIKLSSYIRIRRCHHKLHSSNHQSSNIE